MTWGVFLHPRIITFDLIPHGEKIDFWKSLHPTNWVSQNPFKNVCKVNSKENVVKNFLKFFVRDFEFSWVLVKKYCVLYEKASIWSYLFVSNVGFSISDDPTSLALSEVIYLIFTQKWPKMRFLWKNRNSCENHEIWSRMVWKWVPHDMNDILGPYHDRISKKISTFSLRILVRKNGLFLP